jgi:hypothetical protein
MDSAKKNINLFLLMLFLTFPIWAQPLPGEDPSQKEVPSKEELSKETPPQEGPSKEDLLKGGISFEEEDDDAFIFEAPPLIIQVPAFETRTFDDIFPGMSARQKAVVMNRTGVRRIFEKDDSPTLVPSPASKIDLLSRVMAKKPSHIIEALVVLPYNKGKELDFLDVYNALGNIKNIQDYAMVGRDNDIKIFTDTTRLESAQKRKPIPDPPPTDKLPLSETMYILITDKYMGDLYLRGDLAVSLYGITYSLTNFRDVSFAIFRIMKAERLSAIIYIEPLKEGILIYSMSGLYIPGFIAQRENLTADMNVRIGVLLRWITDGLKKQEDRR